MKFKVNSTIRHSNQMLWLSLILFMVVFLFTGREIRDRQNSIANQMLSRGTLVMDIFDSSIRTGFRTNSGVRLQPLLEELTYTSDIVFITLVMPDGTIIAHNDARRIGEVLSYAGREISIEEMRSLNAQNYPQAKEVPLENSYVFAVYKKMPFLGSASSGAMLIIGQDISPVLEARRQSYTNALFMGSLVFLFAIMGQYAFIRSQNAVEAIKAKRAAENLAAQMVSEVQRLEKEVRRREKLAAIGDLAAGVAHELRNPLSSIKGYATFFAERFPADSQDKKSALILVGEVERLNRVITDLIDVAKPTNANLAETDLVLLISEVLQLIKPEADRNKISIEFSAEDDFPKVWLDPDRIRQALLNICLNAMDAMESSFEKELSINLKSFDHKNYIVEIRDTGSGIDEVSLSRIFDPYYTTKAQGTGLGLVITHKIIEAHDATLIVKSVLNEGSTFTINLAIKPDIQVSYDQ